MRRNCLSLALVLALAAVGCGGSPVTVLTNDPDVQGGCYLGFVTGELVTDQTYGTAILEEGSIQGVPKVLSNPVKWPSGYTGRQSGSQVEVLDKAGRVVARTGTHVRIGGGYEGDHPRYWLACGLLELDGRNPNVWVVPSPMD
jgi:hypothetical protein